VDGLDAQAERSTTAGNAARPARPGIRHEPRRMLTPFRCRHLQRRARWRGGGGWAPSGASRMRLRRSADALPSGAVGVRTGSAWTRLRRGTPLTRAGAGAAVALSLLGLGSLIVPSLDTDATPPGAAVSSDSGQRIQGFGASGAWWPNDLQHF